MPADFNHPLVGRQVVYRAHHPGAKPEQGAVTSVNVEARTVFVNYGRGSTSQGTDADDLKTLEGVRVSDLIERGTGRTTRQIMRAPDEFAFVVASYGMVNFARTLQRRHAPHKTMDIVLASDAYEKFLGTSIHIVVDHAAWEALDDRTAGLIRERQSRMYLLDSLEARKS